MGGGAAMRAAGKVTGVINSGIRGGHPTIPLPENSLTSAASKAKNNNRHHLAGVFSSSDAKIEAASAATPKPILDTDDWDLAGFDEDVGESLPRLVFGGAPTLEEAKEATSELRTAVHEAYLSTNSSGGSYISYPENNMSVLSKSCHSETKACITSDARASTPKHAIQAFRLLHESSAAQTVVASLASDHNVWTAVLQNEELVKFLNSQKTDINAGLDEPVANTEIPDWQSPKFFSEDECNDKNEATNAFNSFFQDIKLRVEEMMSSLSSFFQNLFAGPDAGGKTTAADKAMGASIMGLAIMVIMVVILRRA